MTKVFYEIVEHDGGWSYRVDGVYSRRGARGEGTGRSGRDDGQYPMRTGAGTTKFRKAPIGRARHRSQCTRFDPARLRESEFTRLTDRFLPPNSPIGSPVALLVGARHSPAGLAMQSPRNSRFPALVKMFSGLFAKNGNAGRNAVTLVVTPIVAVSNDACRD
jgi:hypothetical protein